MPQYVGGEKELKTILVLALLVAMLAVPAIVCDPKDNPNANPNSPADLASHIITGLGGANEAGFSEVGHQIAEWGKKTSGHVGVSISQVFLIQDIRDAACKKNILSQAHARGKSFS